MNDTKNIIYLDNNATTMVDKKVVEAMIPYFSNEFGNPSSIYELAHEAHSALENSREVIKEFFGAGDTKEIIFTSCGTESANAAIRGVIEANPTKRHIITTKVEHPCVLNTFKEFEEKGYRVDYLNVDENGELLIDELKTLVDDDTSLVAIMAANNETGAIYPYEEAAEIVKSINPNTKVFIDAVQAAGKIKLDVKNTKVDLMGISGHKFHAPKGVGALYIKKGTIIKPYMTGGHQERGLRGGTENVPYIVGMAKAAELAMAALEFENKTVKELRDRLECGILENVKNARLNSRTKNRVPNTTNIGFEYIEGELILLHLDKLGICASSGSACTSGSLEPSHVLRAMKTPFTSLHGSIRFSLSRFTTKEEIDFVVQNMPLVIKKLAKISPFQKELSGILN